MDLDRALFRGTHCWTRSRSCSRVKAWQVWLRACNTFDRYAVCETRKVKNFVTGRSIPIWFARSNPLTPGIFISTTARAISPS